MMAGLDEVAEEGDGNESSDGDSGKKDKGEYVAL